MKIKKNDIILIAVILVVAVAVLIFINVFVKKDGSMVVLTVDGVNQGSYSLNENREIDIPGFDGEGHNHLIISDGMAYMSEADCRDKICVNQGKISKTGETIVCLPHRVVVEIKSNSDKQLDGVVQ